MRNIWKILLIVAVAVGMVSALAIVIMNNDKYIDARHSYVEPSAENGEIGDHIKGSKDAKVFIFEYADFQCSGCAAMNTKIDKAIEKLNGKVAVIYRNYILSYHTNGTAAASAAEAAGLQGYWKEYGNYLFEKQDDWFYDTASKRVDHFKQYFIDVTEGKGDIDKFLEDMNSKAVAKKIQFDTKLGNQMGIPGTPALFVDGQLISWSKAGDVTVNGKKISWDSSRGTEEGVLQLFTDILNAKTGE